jgi:predicted choloylglycine hydrolase
MRKKVTKKKTVMLVILLSSSVILVFAIFELAKFASFPGKITTPEYKVTTEGVKSTFRDGVIYRYPGMVPLLSVSGDHYEMGLQYGVLLRPEIMEALETYGKILRWEARKAHVPYPIFTAVLKFKAKRMSRRLPERFLEEIKGVSEGSGVPEDAIIMVSLFYDVGMAMGCTSVLMRGRDGAIIHGRNNDWSESDDLGKLTVVVRHRADGYNSVTHIDFPLWLGVETGYNDAGLAFSEETYGIKKPDPQGFPIVFLARMALESCSTLEDVYRFLDEHSVVGGHGTVWSDRNEGKGAVVELTPTATAVRELKGSLLWNFNRIYDSRLRPQQRVRTSLDGWNWDREAIASTFPEKQEYEIEDAVQFLRAQETPDGTDYAWCGTKSPICNSGSLQMVVFDPYCDGFYLATGNSFAACRNVYHVHEDFSRVPELIMKAVPIKPVVEEAAEIKNRLVGGAEKLKAYVELAQKYKNDANAQFLVAYHSFMQSRWDLFADYAQRAYSMKPLVVEYKLFAGIAACQQKQYDKAINLLQNIDSSGLHPWQEIFRLTALERAWASRSAEKSAHYNAQKRAILDKYDAHVYYRKGIAPLFEELNKRVEKND